MSQGNGGSYRLVADPELHQTAQTPRIPGPTTAPITAGLLGSTADMHSVVGPEVLRPPALSNGAATPFSGHRNHTSHPTGIQQQDPSILPL
ncbi:hypothetical protein NDU88_002954 [Pleurodeles waltl]|uniref:Uncharacterized protein n=1 Tax=Pleurodeles waltl TaxID=8319 RepID=A0AAV7REB2_PLEWA|nr:hypothetical protein NDU88_002954 [Pleurodeles waltl]